MLRHKCLTEIEVLQSQADESSQHISIQFNRATANYSLSRIQEVTGHALYPRHAQAHIIVVNLRRRSIDGPICLPLAGKGVELWLERRFFYSQFLHLALVASDKRIRPPCKVCARSPFSRHVLAGYPGGEILLPCLLHSHEAALTIRENLIAC